MEADREKDANKANDLWLKILPFRMISHIDGTPAEELWSDEDRKTYEDLLEQERQLISKRK